MLVDLPAFRDFEIVIGLVAPIGTDVKLVSELLSVELQRYRYDSEVVRLSRLLDRTPLGQGLPQDPGQADYYAARMKAGDDLRELCGSGDALAGYAITRILELRSASGLDRPERRLAWILRTIKHPDELALLRATYGRRFLALAVNQPPDVRFGRLRAELLDANPGATELDAKVARLLERDELDASNSFGQHVRDAYCRADYFVDIVDRQQLETSLARFAGLVFGRPFITPSKDEAAMYLAHSASLRSADPGRQVGAVVTTMMGDVLAIGTNEVPKAGGGEYWEDDPVDNRDFRLGYDYNKRATRRAMRELLDALAENGHLTTGLKALAGDERLNRVLDEDAKGLVKNSRAMSLIEFGRIVHAEMSAITAGARHGVSIAGGTLYTTAYPCHLCMRLIIAAGILRVVYVDPYPKSLAAEMYSTEIDPLRKNVHSIDVVAFSGTSWTIYGDVFSAVNRNRAEDGAFPAWDHSNARFRLADPDPIGLSAELELQVPVALELATTRGVDQPTVGALGQDASEGDRDAKGDSDER